MYVVATHGLWQHHPEGFTSLQEYCKQPEIDISPSVLSDMLNLAECAPELTAKGVDIWGYVVNYGQSKVRQVIPLIRNGRAIGDITAFAQPVLDALPDATYREVLAMTSRAGRETKTAFSPAVVYTDHDDGTVSIHFDRITINDLEEISSRLKSLRWFNVDGVRIPHPLDFGGRGFDDLAEEEVPVRVHHKRP
jgi:hypothetical protein